MEDIKIRAAMNKIEIRNTTENINKSKGWFLGERNKTDQPLTRLRKKKREDTNK